MSKQVISLASGGTLEVLEDGTKIQRNPEGTILTLLPNGVKRQRTKDGIEIEVRPDGSRTQIMTNGVVLEVNADGSSKQTNPDGTIVETFADKRRVQTHVNGTVIEVFPDGKRIQTFPDGKKVEVDSTGRLLPLQSSEPKSPDTSNSKPKVLDTTNTSETESVENDSKGGNKRDSFRGTGRVPVRKSITKTNADELLKNELKGLRDQVAAYEKKIKSLEEKSSNDLERFENHILNVNQTNSRDIQAKDEVISQLSRHVEASEFQIEKLRKMSELSAQKPSCAGAQSFSVSEIDSLNESIHNLTAQLNHCRAENNSLTNENMSLKKENEELLSRVEDLIDKGGSIAEEVSSLTDQNDQLTKSQAEKEIEISKLNADLAVALSHNSDLELRVTSLLNDVHCIGAVQKRELYLSKYKNYQLKEETSPSHEAKNTSFESAESLESVVLATSETKKSKRHMSSLIFGRRTSDSQKSGLQERIKSLEARIGELEVNIEQKDLMIKEGVKFTKELKDQLKIKDDTINQLNSISVMDDAKDSSNAEESQKIKEELSQKLSEAQAENSQNLSKIAELEREVKNLSGQLEELVRIKQDLDNFEAENQASMARISLLEDELVASKNTESGLKGEVAGLREQVCELEAKIKNPDFSSKEELEVEQATQTEETEKSDKYSKMRKAGVPEAAIAAAMERDGVNTLQTEDLVVEKNNEALPEFAKYKRMKNAGVPEGAIRIAIKRDGLDPKVFFGEVDAPTVATTPALASPMKNLAMQIQNGITLKKTIAENTNQGKITPPSSPIPNSLLAEMKMKGSRNLRKISSPPSRAKLDKSKDTIAEFCRLKAQQRAKRSEQINEILNKNKPSVEETTTTSELQAALERRAKKIQSSD